MAIFRPNAKGRVCVLNFDEKVKFELPLHENTARKLGEIAQKQADALARLEQTDPTALDKAYNYVLDALDELLGENAGAEIMSIYENPSVFDVAEVVTYIGNEYKAAYADMLGAQKQAGVVQTEQRGRRCF